MVESKTPPIEANTPVSAGSSTAHGEPIADSARDAYDKAQTAYKKQVAHYWTGAEAEKSAHHKILDFPPAYSGPAKPKGYDPPRPPSTLPSVNDMTNRWLEFEPLATGGKYKGPVDEGSESQFKENYAREALHVGQTHGLSADQSQKLAESIYAFEDAGKGTADLLSGVPFRLTQPDQPGQSDNRDKRRDIHPISTAMGYNQLLMATTLGFVDCSHAINDRLAELEKENPGRASQIKQKEQLLGDVQRTVHEQLQKFAAGDPGKYLKPDGSFQSAIYADFAKSGVKTDLGMTGREETSAVQALNLDQDIGPVIQAQQLNDIVSDGLKPDFQSALGAKAVEDGADAQKFFQLPQQQRQAAVDELLGRVIPNYDPKSTTAGAAKTLHDALIDYGNNPSTPLTQAALGSGAYQLLSDKVVALKRRGDSRGPLSSEGASLEDSLYRSVMNKPGADDYLPAALELSNLAGAQAADEMIRGNNGNDSTVNYFDEKGYEANPITNGRTADELLKSILHSMHGANGSPNNYGMADMIKAFDAVNQQGSSGSP